MMDLSISIVNWNTRDLLDQCLESVFSTSDGVDIEVIVVDNASSDGSPEMLKSKYSGVELIENTRNVGFSRANNQAYGVSQGRYFALLNSDTIVSAGAFETLVKWMDNEPSTGICAPMLLNVDGTLQPSWAAAPSFVREIRGGLDRRVDGRDLSTLDPQRLSEHPPFETGWVGGACMVVRRSAIESVGLMDEGFFMYCEETEWCWRMCKAGWSVMYIPQTNVVHLGGMSSRMVPFKTRLRSDFSKTRLFWLMGGHYRLSAPVLGSVLTAKTIARMLLAMGRDASSARQ